MPDSRSLCDRRSRPRWPNALSEEEISALLAEDEAAPACGSCLLLVSRIRREASALLKLHPEVWPEEPYEAWRNLEGTRWALRLDLGAFAERDRSEINAGTRYDAFTLQVDPKSVDDLITEHDAAGGSGF